MNALSSATCSARAASKWFSLYRSRGEGGNSSGLVDAVLVPFVSWAGAIDRIVVTCNDAKTLGQNKTNLQRARMPSPSTRTTNCGGWAAGDCRPIIISHRSAKGLSHHAAAERGKFSSKRAIAYLRFVYPPKGQIWRCIWLALSGSSSSGRLAPQHNQRAGS